MYCAHAVDLKWYILTSASMVNWTQVWNLVNNPKMNYLCLHIHIVLGTRQFDISDIAYVCGYNGGGPTVK